MVRGLQSKRGVGIIHPLCSYVFSLQAAYNPLSLLLSYSVGLSYDLSAVDAGELAPRGVKLCWWHLHTRALDKGGVLWGYYIIPKDLDQPIISVINPQVGGGW